MLGVEGLTLYRIHLTEEQRAELHRCTRAPGVEPRTRDRLEMVRLADAGWRVPHIATHLRIKPRRVRFWLKRFLEAGFAALADQPHPGQTSRLTRELLAAVRQELDKGDRTWTTRQLTAWLAETHGVSFSRDHLGGAVSPSGARSGRNTGDPVRGGVRVVPSGCSRRTSAE